MKKSKILLFDDDKDMCDELSEILKDEGYSVDVANSGREGLGMIENKRYDLVLLDLKMPGMDGYDVLGHIKSRYPDINVIVMTGSAAGRKDPINEILAGKDSGKTPILKLADRVINKPFNLNALLSDIAALIVARKRRE